MSIDSRILRGYADQGLRAVVRARGVSDMHNNANYLVFEADIVGSTRLTATRRNALQVEITDLVSRLNTLYEERLRTRLLIAAGDSFQAVVDDPAVIPDLVWDTWLTLVEVDVRLGIGFGPIYTELSDDSRLMDGPAFHNAAKFRAKEQGIFFRGFGDAEDAVLNGIGTLLRTLFHHFTIRQREAVALLRAGESQSEVADTFEVSKQAVSRLVKVAGWYGYQQGEEALREALKLFMRARGNAS